VDQLTSWPHNVLGLTSTPLEETNKKLNILHAHLYETVRQIVLMNNRKHIFNKTLETSHRMTKLDLIKSSLDTVVLFFSECEPWAGFHNQ